MDSSQKKIGLAVGLLAVVALGGFMVMGSSGPDCQQQYDDVVNGSMPAGDISDSCRPVPEDVENKVLMSAFQEMS